MRCRQAAYDDNIALMRAAAREPPLKATPAAAGATPGLGNAAAIAAVVGRHYAYRLYAATAVIEYVSTEPQQLS